MVLFVSTWIKKERKKDDTGYILFNHVRVLHILSDSKSNFYGSSNTLLFFLFCVLKKKILKNPFPIELHMFVSV